MSLHKTRIALKSNVKTAQIDLLNAKLAESIDLALVTKQAHWNLRGREFIAVHEMLDKFRADLDAHVDTIAERVAQLGGQALGTVQAVASATPLKAYPTTISTIDDHLKQLIERYGETANSIREAIGASDEVDDKTTADIFTAYSRSLDKALWFMEAHVQP